VIRIQPNMQVVFDNLFLSPVFIVFMAEKKCSSEAVLTGRQKQDRLQVREHLRIGIMCKVCLRVQ